MEEGGKKGEKHVVVEGDRPFGGSRKEEEETLFSLIVFCPHL